MKWAVNDDLTASDALKSWLGMSTSTTLTAPTNATASDGTSSSSVVVSWTASAGLRTTRSTAPPAQCSLGLRLSARPPRRATRTPPSSWTPFTRTGSRHHPLPQHPLSQRLTPGLLSRGGANSRIFTATGTFVVPSGVTSLTGCVVWAKAVTVATVALLLGFLRERTTRWRWWWRRIRSGTIPVTAGETLDIIITSSGSAIREAPLYHKLLAGSNGALVEPLCWFWGAGGTGGSFDGTTQPRLAMLAQTDAGAGSGSWRHWEGNNPGPELGMERAEPDLDTASSDTRNRIWWKSRPQLVMSCKSKSSPPIEPVNGPLDTRSLPADVGYGSWRWRQNMAAVPMNKLCRRNGWRKFLYTESRTRTTTSTTSFSAS